MVFFALGLLKLVKMMHKFSKLVGNKIGVWQEVKMLLTKSLLHSSDVKGQFIFSCDFNAAGKMINFLVLIQAFIKISLAVAARPEQVPVVGFSVLEIVCFEDAANELSVTIENFIKQF